jgi:hypothetical protein
VGASIATVLLATPALAGVLPFEGAFGNVDGCHLYMTGDFRSDDVFLLTPDTFTSYGTACDFEELLSSNSVMLTIDAICSSEGEEGSGAERVTIINHGEEGYGIRFEGLEEWGPYAACPVTELDDGGVHI